MPLYPFRCEGCGAETVVSWPIKDYDNLPVPKHCRKKMEQVPQVACFVAGRTVGRDSGFYDLDYGKRATEDLTVPGKIEKLKRMGRIKPDPWDNAPASPPPSQETIDAFR